MTRLDQLEALLTADGWPPTQLDLPTRVRGWRRVMARRAWLMRFDAEGDFQSPGAHACLVEELLRHCRVDVLGVADFWTIEQGWVLTITLEGAEPLHLGKPLETLPSDYVELDLVAAAISACAPFVVHQSATRSQELELVCVPRSVVHEVQRRGWLEGTAVDTSVVKRLDEREAQRIWRHAGAASAIASPDELPAAVPSDPTIRQWFIDWHAGSAEAESRIVECHLRVALTVIRTIAPVGIDFLALVQVGNAALMKALHAYDPEASYCFAELATYHIIADVAAHVSSTPDHVRLPRQVRSDMLAELSRLGTAARHAADLVRTSGHPIELAELPESEGVGRRVLEIARSIAHKVQP